MKRLDGSENAALNPVQLPDGSLVSWAQAFPRDFAVQFAGTRPMQPCRDCGQPMQRDPDADRCPACVAEMFGTAA